MLDFITELCTLTLLNTFNSPTLKVLIPDAIEMS
jgi:hypothetical protein